MIFVLALWPEEQYEIDFYEKSSAFTKRVRQIMTKIDKIYMKWVQD